MNTKRVLSPKLLKRFLTLGVILSIAVFALIKRPFLLGTWRGDYAITLHPVLTMQNNGTKNLSVGIEFRNNASHPIRFLLPHPYSEAGGWGMDPEYLYLVTSLPGKRINPVFGICSNGMPSYENREYSDREAFLLRPGESKYVFGDFEEGFWRNLPQKFSLSLRYIVDSLPHFSLDPKKREKKWPRDLFRGSLKSRPVEIDLTQSVTGSDYGDLRGRLETITPPGLKLSVSPAKLELSEWQDGSLYPTLSVPDGLEGLTQAERWAEGQRKSDLMHRHWAQYTRSVKAGTNSPFEFPDFMKEHDSQLERLESLGKAAPWEFRVQWFNNQEQPIAHESYLNQQNDSFTCPRSGCGPRPSMRGSYLTFSPNLHTGFQREPGEYKLRITLRAPTGEEFTSPFMPVQVKARPLT